MAIKELARFVVDVIADKKGEDIVLLDISSQTVIADYFILCSAGSDRQIKAIVNDIGQQVKKEFGIFARSVEGNADAGWVLIDLGDIVVHVFNPDARAFYDLETWWHEATVLLKMQ
ncbi:MAG: ribosome silencing factor [Anaerolineae bacterium]|nr:ribosome silencing factor [Anaerolineae bacterium]